MYRASNGAVELVLCGRNVPATWSLPKGTPEPGETIMQTALREVREETGLEIFVESDLGLIEYWFRKPGARVHKQVQFFLMSPTGGSIDDHDPEFDRIQWFDSDQALKSMSFPSEVELVNTALKKVRELQKEAGSAIGG